jgi:hypothetical protein
MAKNGSILVLAFVAVLLPARAPAARPHAVLAPKVEQFATAEGPVVRGTESSGFGAAAYQNEPQGAAPFWPLNFPNHVYESITFAAGAAPTELAEFDTGIRLTVAQGLKLEVKFWDLFDSTATPVNSGQLGPTLTYDLGTVPAGSQLRHLTIDPVIPVADPEIGIEFRYLNRTTDLPVAGTATALFAGQGAQAGSSRDEYYRDANGDEVFDWSDARTFGGAPKLANFYLTINSCTWYHDADGDGFGDHTTQIVDCLGGDVPFDYVANSADCDDTNAAAFPGTRELCGNHVDDDCDGLVANDRFDGGVPPGLTATTRTSSSPSARRSGNFPVSRRRDQQHL